MSAATISVERRIGSGGREVVVEVGECGRVRLFYAPDAKTPTQVGSAGFGRATLVDLADQKEAILVAEAIAEAVLASGGDIETLDLDLIAARVVV